MSETFAALLAEREAVNAKIEAIKAEERDSAIAETRTVIAQFAITADELFPASKRSTNVVSIKRPPVAAKYRDPVSGKTWSGRGKQPNWIKGQEREQFKLAA